MWVIGMTSHDQKEKKQGRTDDDGVTWDKEQLGSHLLSFGGLTILKTLSTVVPDSAKQGRHPRGFLVSAFALVFTLVLTHPPAALPQLSICVVNK